MYVSFRVGMTGFQRWVVGVAAALLAARLFFPVTYVSYRGFRFPRSYWPGIDSSTYGAPLSNMAPITDMPTTLLHVLGILLLAALAFVLGSSISDRKPSAEPLGLPPSLSREPVRSQASLESGKSSDSSPAGGLRSSAPATSSESVSPSPPTPPVETSAKDLPATTPVKDISTENTRRNSYLIPWTIAALLALALLIGRSTEGIAYTVGDLIGRAALLFFETRLARLGLERIHTGPRAVAWLTALGVIFANMVIAVALGQDEHAVRRDSVYYLPGLLVWVGWDNKRGAQKVETGTSRGRREGG